MRPNKSKGPLISEKKQPLPLAKQSDLIKKKKQDSSKNKIFENEFDMTCEGDIVFLRDFLVPYLSNVYRSLLQQSRTEFLPLWRIREYLGL